jgi:enterochelin esterase family protein
MRTVTLLLSLLALFFSEGASPSKGGDEPVTPPKLGSLFPDYDTFLESLVVATTAEKAEREAQIDALWDALRAEGRFPFVHGDRVAFLYRGEAENLTVVGDFSGWKPGANRARRLIPSDVWIQEETLPSDARLDYKFIRNGGEWLMDPENPRQQLGGFGPNSELRMPEYVASPWVARREGVAQGTLEPPRSIQSQQLGYEVSYRVYVPDGYDELEKLPAIYVTDGHEYAHDDMGSMVIVLDNLIAAGRIPPVLAVFIDPRVGGRNLRGEQYVLREAFAQFVAQELVPQVDGSFRTDARREARAILGTSLGGLNSAWFALRIPETFRLIAMQSPAFHAGDGAITRLYRESPSLDVKMHMSWGTFFDFGDVSKEMVGILQGKGYDLITVTTHEGHSWGQWRALLDDVLIHFWGSD